MLGTPLLSEVAKELASKLDFKNIHYEGKGAFKETYRVTTDKGEVVALKLYNPDKCNPARSIREIDILRKCDTPLIARLYDYGELPVSGRKYKYMIEEFLDGGSLANQIDSGSLSPDIIKKYAFVLIESLDYLRKNELVHRDIKPDNIMFRDDAYEPVLVDFGIARDLSKSSLTPTFLPQGPGTPYYSAPEQLNNDKHLIGWRTDQFCLGVVLGICLTGYHPFEEEGMSKGEIVERVALRKPCSDRFCRNVTNLGFEGIIKMIQPWPTRRFRLPSNLREFFISRG